MSKLAVTEIKMTFNPLSDLEKVYSFMKAKKGKGDFILLFLDNLESVTSHVYGDDLFFYTDNNDKFLDAVVTNMETNTSQSVKNLYKQFSFIYLNRPDVINIPTLPYPNDDFPSQYSFEG